MRELKQKLRSKSSLRKGVGILLLLAVAGFGSSSAQTPIDKLKSEISEKQEQLSGINTEINILNQRMRELREKKASLSNEIALFDLGIRQAEIKINAVQLEIDKLGSEVKATEIEIQQKQEEIDRQKKFLGETLRLINEYDTVTPVEIALANETFSEFLDQVQYATNLQDKTQELLLAIKELQKQLKEKREQLVVKQREQESLKLELVASQNALEAQRADRQVLLDQTRGQEKVYQQMLTEANQKQDQIEREIYETEVALRAALGDKALPPHKGLLRWPMSGILTQGYGRTGFTALGYNFHNGYDIAGGGGTKIYSAGDGVVHATGTGKAAYGNWVVIKHNLEKNGKTYNIYTIYGHMQRFVVSTGQVVKGGDIIGYEGNTGNTTRLLYGEHRGYHLHFTVCDARGFRINDGAYQNIYGPYQIPICATYNPGDFLP